VALVSFVGCGKGGGGAADTVATVNGTPITKEELMRYMMLKQNVQVMSNRGAVDAKVAQPLGFQALNDLVKQKLLVQMAKQANVYPAKADVDKEIQFRMDGDPNFVKNLTRQGMDTDAIREALSVEMSQRALLTRGITVTDQEIDDFIKANPKQFTQPESWDIDWILVKSAATKKQVDDALNHGQPFDQIAMQYSEANGAKEMHGAFPYHDLDKIPYKEISDPLRKTPELKSTDWIPSGGSYAKFYVAKKTPSKPVELTPHMREVLRRDLAQQKGSKAQDIEKQITSQEKSSDIKVQMVGLQDIWAAYMKSLEQSMPTPSIEKATGAGAATTAGGTTPAPTPAATTTGK